MATYQQVLKRYATKYMKKIQAQDDRDWLRDNSYTLWSDPEFIEEFHRDMQVSSNASKLETDLMIYLDDEPDGNMGWMLDEMLDEEIERRL